MSLTDVLTPNVNKLNQKYVINSFKNLIFQPELSFLHIINSFLLIEIIKKKFQSLSVTKMCHNLAIYLVFVFHFKVYELSSIWLSCANFSLHGKFSGIECSTLYILRKILTISRM